MRYASFCVMRRGVWKSMRGNRLLGWLAACEANIFGLGEPHAAGETWVARERRLARIYFAIGLTGSAIAGSVAMALVLALTPGRLGDKAHWLGWASDDKAAAVARAEPANVPPRADRLLARAPLDEMRKPAVIPADVMAPVIGVRPAPQPEPTVATVKVVPAIVNPQPAPVPAVAKVDAKARKADAARKQAPVAKPNAKTEVPAPVAETPAINAPPTSAPLTAAVRPDGLLSLGGPGSEKDDPARSWWRQVWWKLPLPHLQHLVPAKPQ